MSVRRCIQWRPTRVIACDLCTDSWSSIQNPPTRNTLKKGNLKQARHTTAQMALSVFKPIALESHTLSRPSLSTPAVVVLDMSPVQMLCSAPADPTHARRKQWPVCAHTPTYAVCAAPHQHRRCFFADNNAGCRDLQ